MTYQYETSGNNYPPMNPVAPYQAYSYQTMPPPYLYAAPPPVYDNTAPPLYLYTPPPSYELPPYNPPVLYSTYDPNIANQTFSEPSPIPNPSAPPQGTPPPFIPTINDSAPRQDEVTANFSDNSYTDTNQHYDGDYSRVTHLNYHSNYLTTIIGLERYPNLIRLTLGNNNLESLMGIEKVPHLRWLDISSNYLNNFKGMNVFPVLEWLDCTNNNLKNFQGLAFAPNLTWLCAHHNHLTSLSGVENFKNLRFLDISSSDLPNVWGLEKLGQLQEVNMCLNYLKDVQSVKALSVLPYLFRINIWMNDFTNAEEQEIIDHFRRTKPDFEVVTTEHRAKQLGYNTNYQGPSDENSSNCCQLL